MRNKGKQREFIYRKRHVARKGEIHRKKCLKSTSYNGQYSSEDEETGFMSFGYSHKVLSHLKRENFELSGLNFGYSRTVVIRLPRVFSISESPEDTIKTLRKLYTMGKNPIVKKIRFEYDECERIGLSASTIMDIIVLAIERLRKDSNWDLELEGNYPKKDDVRTILCASGLPYHLKIRPAWLVDEQKIKRFQTVSGEGQGHSCKASITATEMTMYFDECLGTQGFELNDEGKRKLSGIIGEVLDNCESHGGKGATWYTQGHYQVGKDNTYGEMQLLFLSLGTSIYEGLKYDSSKETQNRLEDIKSKLEYKFGNEETLYTLLSLQEGISRLRDGSREGYGGRGCGTVRMIQFFEDIGETVAEDLEQQLSVLSGNTFISFGKKYKMEPVCFDRDKAFGTGNKQIIAFNEQNDIYREPDKKYVRTIKERFPGTVISLKFYLDGRYIRKQSGIGE